MLTSDTRYQLLAIHSAQHLRAVADRVVARSGLPPLNFSALLWRKVWLSPIPPLLQTESANKFLQENGCSYPRPHGFRSWITSGNKSILDIHSSEKLIYLANFIENNWHIGQQMAIWRKHPTNRLNGYAYNIVQILMNDKISDDYPAKYYLTLHYNLLANEFKNKRLISWIETYQKESKDPFIVASLELTQISNMRTTFLWQITLETLNGLYTTLNIEATPGDAYLCSARPFETKRVHPFIGYI